MEVLIFETSRPNQPAVNFHRWGAYYCLMKTSPTQIEFYDLTHSVVCLTTGP